MGLERRFIWFCVRLGSAGLSERLSFESLDGQHGTVKDHILMLKQANVIARKIVRSSVVNGAATSHFTCRDNLDEESLMRRENLKTFCVQYYSKRLSSFLC